MDIQLGQCRYALRYWLADPQRDDGTDSAVRMHLMAALARSGIPFALPKQVDYEIKENEKRQAARLARETEQRMAALRKVDLFAPLSEPELATLCRHLVHAPFLAGDVITRQGAVAHWLYLLVSGEAEVWLESADAPRRRVAVLEPGTVFGEMGMLTGEARRATVTSKTDVMCYRLDKPGFEEVLRARPTLAEALSAVLASRAGGLAQVLEEARSAAVTHETSVLERIRAFFGLDSGQNAPRRAA
jgi:CRP-like cAMP-binding protein